jgi:hypothetical protein
METTLLCCALMIAGGLVYGADDHAGALLIAAGCALASVHWIDRRWFTR